MRNAELFYAVRFNHFYFKVCKGTVQKCSIPLICYCGLAEWTPLEGGIFVDLMFGGWYN